MMRQLLVVLLPLVLVLSAAAASVSYFTFDLWLTRHLQEITNPAFRALMISVSWIGYGVRIWLAVVAAALLLALVGLRIEAICTFVSGVGGGILTTLLKLVIGRPRPSVSLVSVYLNHPTESFPSGHVVSYVALYGFLFYVVYVRLPQATHARLRFGLLTLCALPVALVGLSRVYLGAHWASDVAGGYGVGLIWLLLVIELYWRLRLRRTLTVARD